MNLDAAMRLLRPILPGRRVRQIAVPRGARALSSLSHIDYEDAFTLETFAARERTGEQWARTILSSGSGPAQGALLWILSSVVGLELGPIRANGFILGWEVRQSAPEFALLAAKSSRIGLSAELVFMRDERTVLFATFVQLETWIARAMWRALSPLHRQVVPHLLERVDRRREANER
jgi:hypothetical protein